MAFNKHKLSNAINSITANNEFSPQPLNPSTPQPLNPSTPQLIYTEPFTMRSRCSALARLLNKVVTNRLAFL